MGRRAGSLPLGDGRAHGHSAGASRRRVTPMPRGNRPSMAACTSLGARNASDIVILTCRMLHCSRAAISSTQTVPATISSSQWRPRAIDATGVARVSARIGRASWGAADWGTTISRRRFDGGFFQGTRRTMRSASSWPLSRLGGVGFSLPGVCLCFGSLRSITNWSACTSTRATCRILGRERTLPRAHRRRDRRRSRHWHRVPAAF